MKVYPIFLFPIYNDLLNSNIAVQQKSVTHRLIKVFHSGFVSQWLDRGLGSLWHHTLHALAGLFNRSESRAKCFFSFYLFFFFFVKSKLRKKHLIYNENKAMLLLFWSTALKMPLYRGNLQEKEVTKKVFIEIQQVGKKDRIQNI